VSRSATIPIAPLMSVGQVATALQVSRTTIYRLAGAGRLEAVRVGGVVRFEPETVLSYIARQRTGDPSPQAALQKYPLINRALVQGDRSPRGNVRPRRG
jgi:excisionase family DNA binding protein